MVTSPHPRPATDQSSDPSGRSTPARPAHVADLLRLLVREPGRPRVTWYGDDGERVELSGAVLENWVAKTTNLLVEEFDAGPGTTVVLDLPVHWRQVLWALASWRVGATVVIDTQIGTAAEGAGVERAGAGVVVTTRPDAWQGPTPGAAAGRPVDLVAVALPALARRFDGDLPPGAVDAASAVMTYGDQVGWAPDPDLAEDALRDGRDVVVHGSLVGPARPGATPGARVLLRGDGEPAQTLRAVLDVLADDGSVVLLSADRTRTLDDDPAATDRLVASERVTGS
ncbi:TIGR03089 family protein [Cellulosimicrobium terreum]|nr:TIGR03089 family protein [Cellulosimicrobium terreum]